MTLFAVSLFQKWQRRFFILYEDGSLSFALDELVSRRQRDCDRTSGLTEQQKDSEDLQHAGIIFRPDVARGAAADDLGLVRPLMRLRSVIPSNLIPRVTPRPSPATHAAFQQRDSNLL